MSTEEDAEKIHNHQQIKELEKEQEIEYDYSAYDRAHKRTHVTIELPGSTGTYHETKKKLRRAKRFGLGLDEGYFYVNQTGPNPYLASKLDPESINQIAEKSYPLLKKLIPALIDAIK